MVILEPNLKASQSMYLTNLFTFDQHAATFKKKQAFLQVDFELFSGVAYLSIYWIFLELKQNFDVIKWRIVLFVYRVQRM